GHHPLEAGGGLPRPWALQSSQLAVEPADLALDAAHRRPDRAGRRGDRIAVYLVSRHAFRLGTRAPLHRSLRPIGGCRVVGRRRRSRASVAPAKASVVVQGVVDAGAPDTIVSAPTMAGSPGWGSGGVSSSETVAGSGTMTVMRRAGAETEASSAAS